jgi:hypothetical protein
MLKHGVNAHWRAVAARIARLDERSGVTVAPRLPYSVGSRIMFSLRTEEAEKAIAELAGLVGFEAVPRPRGVIDKKRTRTLGRIDGLVTRYPDSEVPVCQFARKNKIPIYRPDEFAGGIAETLLASEVDT